MTRPTNRELARLAATVGADLDQLRASFGGGLAQRIAEAEAGPGGRRVGSSGHHGETTHSDPTAAAALCGADLAGLHRAELAGSLNRARAAIGRALDIASSYPEPHPAGDADRLALARLNDHADPGCESCARTHGPAGTPRWEPPDVRLDGYATTVDGHFPEPMQLCRWCVDRVRLWGRLPTPAEVELHHRAGRVPWPADVAHPA